VNKEIQIVKEGEENSENSCVKRNKGSNLTIKMLLDSSSSSSESDTANFLESPFPPVNSK